MNKKRNIIICIIIIITLIGIIILFNKSKTNIFEDVIKLNDYEVKIKDCNNIEKELPKEILTNIADNWNNISNNGPWLGDINTCYNRVSITYIENNVSKEIEILLIDDTSLVLTHNNNSTYYTNTTDINKALLQTIKE